MVDVAIITEVLSSAFLFILLWMFVGNKMFKPYIALLEEREARTAGDENLAADTLSKRAEVEAQLESELRQGRLEAIAVRDGYIEQANSEARDIIEQAATKARAELGVARDEISKLKESARADVAKEADVVAGALLEKLVPGTSLGRVVH